VPALSGCASQGDTEQEALENIKDAIKTQLIFKKKLYIPDSSMVALMRVFPIFNLQSKISYLEMETDEIKKSAQDAQVREVEIAFT